MLWGENIVKKFGVLTGSREPTTSSSERQRSVAHIPHTDRWLGRILLEQQLDCLNHGKSGWWSKYPDSELPTGQLNCRRLLKLKKNNYYIDYKNTSRNIFEFDFTGDERIFVKKSWQGEIKIVLKTDAQKCLRSCRKKFLATNQHFKMFQNILIIFPRFFSTRSLQIRGLLFRTVKTGFYMIFWNFGVP